MDVDEIMAQHEKRADEIFRQGHAEMALLAKRVGWFCVSALSIGIGLIAVSVWILG